MIGIGETEAQCSATGCRADAVWRVNWRNPRIHDATRVKVWLACADHRDHLEGYLTSRGFPTRVTDYATAADAVPDRA